MYIHLSEDGEENKTGCPSTYQMWYVEGYNCNKWGNPSEWGGLYGFKYGDKESFLTSGGDVYFWKGLIDMICFSHHLRNFLSGLSWGIRNLSMENRIMDSVPIMINMYRNTGRFSDVKGFNPDSMSFIMLKFKLRHKDRYKLWYSQ